MTPWDQDPVTGRSRLIEDGPYPLRDSTVSNEDAAYFLAKAMRSRYGKGSPERLAQAFTGDLGVPLRMPVRAVNAPMRGHHGNAILGSFDPATTSISYSARDLVDPDARVTTLAHEIGHAADHAETFGQFEPARMSFEDKRLGRHHAGFEDFEPELAGLMTAQAQLERGQAINPDFYRYYPALKRVHPLSSNPLASPWDFRLR